MKRKPKLVKSHYNVTSSSYIVKLLNADCFYKGRSANEVHLVFYEKFFGATETMKEEVISFFNQYNRY